ncbi:MAG: hypothetical protein R2744_04375 [Bacteroidales bacterium]
MTRLKFFSKMISRSRGNTLPGIPSEQYRKPEKGRRYADEIYEETFSRSVLK